MSIRYSCSSGTLTSCLYRDIVTCDYKKILDNTLRECLVNPLPAGTRLTAILDSCHSGTLLDLDHYSCHWFLIDAPNSFRRVRCRQSTIRRRRVVTPTTNAGSRSAQLFRTLFSGAVTAALAVVRLRLKLRWAKRLKVEFEVAGGDDGATLTAPATALRRLVLRIYFIEWPSCYLGLVVFRPTKYVGGESFARSRVLPRYVLRCFIF